MDHAIIKRFDEKRTTLKAIFKKKHPESYLEIVKQLVKAVSCDGLDMDPDRITVIDHGDYQGSQLFIIAAKGYQPSDYWATECSYGSCTGCDTLQAIRGYGDDAVSAKQADDYVTLALHLAQKMEKLFA